MDFLPRVERTLAASGLHGSAGVPRVGIVFFFGAALAAVVASSAATTLVTRKRAKAWAQEQLHHLAVELVQFKGVCARAIYIPSTSLRDIFSLLSGMMESMLFTSNMRAPRVVLLGLDNAGKTSLCQMMARTKRRGCPTGQPRPQHHVLHHWCEMQGQEVHLVDPSGDELRQKEPRLALWDALLKSRPDAVIFVVDASDTRRHELAREALHWTLRHAVVKNIPVLVLGNKIDIGTAVNTWNLKSSLGLAGLSGEQKEALLGDMQSNKGMPFELRHRIAGFHAQEVPAAPHHKGPMAMRMCTLTKSDSVDAGLRWLHSKLYEKAVPNVKASRKCCLATSPGLPAVFARCLLGTQLSRQAALLPLYQA